MGRAVGPPYPSQGVAHLADGRLGRERRAHRDKDVGGAARRRPQLVERPLDGGAVPAFTQARERLALVGLDARADDRTGGFSKGMQQRLGLAVALVAGPELVVLDEPTSALDPLGRVDVRDIVLELKSRDVTGVPPYGLAALGMKRAFQQNAFFDDLSVLDNFVAVLGELTGAGA